MVFLEKRRYKVVFFKEQSFSTCLMRGRQAVPLTNIQLAAWLISGNLSVHLIFQKFRKRFTCTLITEVAMLFEQFSFNFGKIISKHK